MQLRTKWLMGTATALLFGVAFILTVSSSPEAKEKKVKKETPSSYAPVVIEESFATILDRMKAEKPKVMARQMELLKMRYDLSNHPAKGSP